MTPAPRRDEPVAAWAGVSLGELLALDELQLEPVVLPPDGTRRRIRWAQTTEQVDPTPYLRRDELVCTVGAVLVGAGAMATFVDALAAAGVAGLCFGAGDVHPQVPAALVAACAARALPLVTMPRGVPFLAISDHLTAHRQTRLEGAGRRASLGRLLRAVGEGRADPEVLVGLLPAVPDGPDGPVLVTAWPSAAVEAVGRRFPGASVGEEDGTAYAVLTDPSDEAAADRFSAAATALGVPCGYSSPVDREALRGAVVEAQEALRMARRIGGACGPQDLTTVEGLLVLQPPERLRIFMERLVRPLEEHDLHHAGSVLATLREFLGQDGSVTRTARAQFVHVNTVRHRLARVGELTGRDPLDFADRAALAIAVWAFDHDRGRHRGQHRSEEPGGRASAGGEQHVLGQPRQLPGRR